LHPTEAALAVAVEFPVDCAAPAMPEAEKVRRS
jgi:hypothetical protein